MIVDLMFFKINTHRHGHFQRKDRAAAGSVLQDSVAISAVAVEGILFDQSFRG